MTATLCRPLPGSRQHNFYPTHRDTSVASLDSAFQLQEYLAYLIQNDPHDIRRIVSLPKSLSTLDDSRGKDRYLGQEDEKDEAVDESCWIYEHLRRLAQDLNHPLITTLQQECNRETCPEMKAGEWLFLCVAHGNGPNVEKCCAIDYILHTLDSATALLNSPKAFPSRITIPPNSHRHFSSLARRLGRIFGHAYYQHREAFEQSEADTSLYSRFLALAAMYDLVPPDFLDIPHRESSGLSGESEDIEISRAPPDEFGGRGSNSPMGRSRTDTMVRAEGFSLPAEEFEEHIPQSEMMDSVELPASFYHEHEPSPPLDAEAEAEPQASIPTESHEDILPEEVKPQQAQPQEEDVQQSAIEPSHVEAAVTEEEPQDIDEDQPEIEPTDPVATHEDPKEAETKDEEEIDPEVGEMQETTVEPPAEPEEVSVSIPPPPVAGPAENVEPEKEESDEQDPEQNLKEPTDGQDNKPEPATESEPVQTVSSETKDHET